VAQALLGPRARTRSDSGFTLIELLIAVAIIGILAAIAVISMIRARQSGNEASAIGSMRAITGGQAAYASSCGGGGYAQSNADLAKAPNGSPPFISPDLEKADLAASAKSGYVVDVNQGGAAKKWALGKFTVKAEANKTTDLGTGRGGSAHVRTEWTVAGAHVAIAYGRPALKGRDEATLMPPGSGRAASSPSSAAREIVSNRGPSPGRREVAHSVSSARP